ncbi:MAG: hypothetical protein KF781_04465 [Chitinophagaceae bacterium]|nr:hypothetical protein [Chitinophagaceae bacterium]MCW5904663.1 hypothetical protein [Chitinophagaceae bacterium]
MKIFDFNSRDFNLHYKTGFTILTNCCLLIETYVSFRVKKYRSTKRTSRECFAYFFTSEKRFFDLSTGGLPNDFYDNVRCGILHNGETRNGWTITRNKNKPYFEPITKTINATKFANRLKQVLREYQNSLDNSDFDTDDIWINFTNRLTDLISKS